VAIVHAQRAEPRSDDDGDHGDVGVSSRKHVRYQILRKEPASNNVADYSVNRDVEPTAFRNVTDNQGSSSRGIVGAWAGHQFGDWPCAGEGQQFSSTQTISRRQSDVHFGLLKVQCASSE